MTSRRSSRASRSDQIRRLWPFAHQRIAAFGERAVEGNTVGFSVAAGFVAFTTSARGVGFAVDSHTAFGHVH